MNTSSFPIDFTTASLNSRITFTRTTGASNPATYVNSNGYVTSASNNQPRFDYDPVTLACKGLLIEESRVNLMLYSESIANTFISNATYSANSAVSPSNTLTADKLIPNNGVIGHFRETFSFSATTYTASIFAKKAEWKAVTIGQGGVGAYFDLDTGTVGNVNAGYTAKIVSFGNGWYRCSVTFTSAAISENIRYYASNSTTSTTTGNGASGIYVWGWQLESGAFATSYIPTTTAALTRNADVAVITGTNFSDWWQSGKGGAQVQAIPLTVTGIRPLVQYDDGTANEIIALRGNTTNPELYVVDGGSPQAQLDAGTIAANIAYSLTGWWQTNDCKARKDSGAVVTDDTATIPTVTQARLGSDGTNYLNGHLATVNYYDSFFGQSIYTRRKNKVVSSLL